MAEKLTEQQQMAVSDRGGKLLVSAAAGSGKTKVLVDRLMSYLLDSNAPANIDDFLIITFTKAAAAELRGKIASKISEKISENPTNKHLQHQMQRLYLAKISTVHAFCADILREYSYRLDLSADFRVAEETECAQYQIRILDRILEEAYADIGNNTDLQNFIDTQGFGRNDHMIPEIVLQVYNSARCHLNPDGWLEKCADDTAALKIEDAAQTVWGKYIIEKLHTSLNRHVLALSKCRDLSAETAGFEKVTALLSDTIYQLQHLLSFNTWDHIVLHSKLDFGTLRFPKNNNDPILTERIKAVRNFCKDDVSKQLSFFADHSAKILEDLQFTGSATRGLIELVRKFSKEYDKFKRARGILDFNDLEHSLLDLLYGKSRSRLTAAAHEIGDRFREIMVDEYQDSNSVQDAIYMALTDKRSNCFMVGDVKQSIYQFRLADPEIFVEKYATYTHAERAQPGEPRKVLLSSNFRSAGEVINAVNDVFVGCMTTNVGGLDYGEEERLREGIPHVPQVEPEVEFYAIDVREDTYAEEAAFVAQRIKALLDGNHTIRSGESFVPIRPEDIVILLRSPGSVGMEYLTALEALGIRCTMGSSEDLLCTEEVRFLVALLKTIYNPMVDISVATVLLNRVFGFTANELAGIRSRSKKSSLIDALKKDPSEKVCSFLRILEKLRQHSRMSSASDLIQFIFEETKMDSIYAGLDDGSVRTANLQAFAQFVSNYEATGNREIGQLLDYLEIVEEKGMSVSSEQSKKGFVTIMSVHKSKGLEFPVVFLSALSRRFNHDSARQLVLCNKDLGLGLSCVDTVNRVRYPTIAKKAIAEKIVADDISEEMRVLYVAMTRARDRLIMTYAKQNVLSDIEEVVNRIDYSSGELLSASAGCPGQWILQAALKRTESGALFSVTGKPECCKVSDTPWLVKLVNGESSGEAVAQEQFIKVSQIDPEKLEKIRSSLNYCYPYKAATLTPSKQTATQLKGRVKDQEAAENTVIKSQRPVSFRKPSFVTQQINAAAIGNTIHAIMQHIQFDKCSSAENVEAEIARLIKEGFIDQETAAKIDPASIYAFFETDLGKKIAGADRVLREFKFSVLVDGEDYVSAAGGDKVLLQGVVDCALLEDDGLTIVDFKSDHVTESNVQDAIRNYRMQVKAYADALTVIYEKPVKSTYLYFFRISKLYEL